MKKSILFVLIATVVFSIYACSGEDNNGQTSPPPQKSWKLVFEDNFNGIKVNESEWHLYDYPGHDGNGLRRPEAFTVENGILVVTAQMKEGVIVSGGMAHRKNYKYGKFEFRVRTEADPNEATSGVILTWPESERFPLDGENDIYETGTEADRAPFYTYIHYGADNRQYQFVHDADGKEWQIMAMEWFEDVIKIYRNGVLTHELKDKIAIPQVPHHLCIQLDAFKTTMGDPVKMYVDWVKIYQWE